MAEWVVRRWARYGHERLYAETPGGTALGYLDLKTGRYHSDDLSNLPLLEKAIGDHLDGQQIAAPWSPRLRSSRRRRPPLRCVTSNLSCIQRLTRRPRLTGSTTAALAPAARRGTRPTRHCGTGEVQGLPGAGVRCEDRRARLADRCRWRGGGRGTDRQARSGLARPKCRTGGERGSDIDHVLIGPAGVFTVNVKHHPNSSIWVGGDTFMVNGVLVTGCEPEVSGSSTASPSSGRARSARLPDETCSARQASPTRPRSGPAWPAVAAREDSPGTFCRRRPQCPHPSVKR